MRIKIKNNIETNHGDIIISDNGLTFHYDSYHLLYLDDEFISGYTGRDKVKKVFITILNMALDRTSRNLNFPIDFSDEYLGGFLHRYGENNLYEISNMFTRKLNGCGRYLQDILNLSISELQLERDDDFQSYFVDKSKLSENLKENITYLNEELSLAQE